MANVNTKIFKSLNESEYKELYTPKRTLTEATTDANEIAEEYKKAYHIDLDWNRVPCVIARDKFLSGWGGAEGKTHYQVVLCGDSTEAANIEANMRSLGKEEGLANIRRDFGVHLSSRVSKAYVVGRYASAWNNLSKSWYESRFDSGKTEDEINQEKDAQEARRQEKLRQKEQQANESEELSKESSNEPFSSLVKKGGYRFIAICDELGDKSYEEKFSAYELANIIETLKGIYKMVMDDKEKSDYWGNDIEYWENRMKNLHESENLKEWKDGGSINQYAATFVLNSNLSEEELEPKIQEALSELEKDEAIERPIKDITIRHTSTINKRLPESTNLKEEYSEKLGGDPEDFISDVQKIKSCIMEVGKHTIATHLAQEIVDQFIETCDSQISMAKSRFLGESDDIEEFKKKYKKSFDNWKKENPQASDKEIVDILKAKQYNGELNEDEDNIHKMKECTDDVEVIMALEGDTLELDDMEDWNRLKEIARGLASSQGFYGRLLANMEETEEEDLEFPIYL